MLVTWLLIILGNPLANFPSSHSNDGIVGSVVIGILSKDLDPQCALFDVVSPPCQSLGHYEFQKDREALAFVEVRILQKAFELLHNGSLVFFARRCPAFHLLGQHSFLLPYNKTENGGNDLCQSIFWMRPVVTPPSQPAGSLPVKNSADTHLCQSFVSEWNQLFQALFRYAPAFYRKELFADHHLVYTSSGFGQLGTGVTSHRA